MTQQFLRQLNLVVSSKTEAIDFGAFWCSFTVKRGDFQTPNSLNARIYNLKSETMNTISQLEFTTASLSAGYQYPGTSGNSGLLFEGNIVQFRKGRLNQLDSYVDITASDSDEAYNFAPIATTIPAGSKPGTVAAAIAGAFANASNSQGITQGYQPNYKPDALVRGRVMFGMARDEARAFANQNQCKWSLQDGKVTYIPWVSYIPAGQVPVISVSTGLIGVPEQTQSGINIKTLMNSTYKVGQLVQLNSQINQFRYALDFPSQTTNTAIALQNQIAPNIGPNTGNPSDQQGLYYIMVANHTGDTRGENWYTDLTCLSVDATLVNQDQNNALVQTGPNPIFRYGGT
jgi:hypothetical protein